MYREKILVVFVHLGNNPSHLLIPFALQASSALESAEVVLITDIPKNWPNFPGKVIEYVRRKEFSSLNRILESRPQLLDIASGYWFYTLERIFALSVLSKHYDSECKMLHFESDVFSNIDEVAFDLIFRNFQTTAVPRLNSLEAVGSIIFSPNLNELDSSLHKLNTILMRNSKLENDMKLLGHALNDGSLIEISTSLSESLVTDKNKQIRYVVDGAALGQYLLGQDPIHTKNRVISGFQNPSFSIDLASCKWKIEFLRDQFWIVVTYRDNDYYLVNLHNHSKRILEPIHKESVFWNRIIDEANGDIVRKEGEYSEEVIHSKPYKFETKLRNIIEMGVLKYLVQKFKA